MQQQRTSTATETTPLANHIWAEPISNWPDGPFLSVDSDVAQMMISMLLLVDSPNKAMPLSSNDHTGAQPSSSQVVTINIPDGARSHD